MLFNSITSNLFALLSYITLVILVFPKFPIFSFVCSKGIPNILHKERGCLCQERVPKDTVTERAIFYFSLRNSEHKMLSHVDLCHLHLSQFAFKNN